MLKLFQGQHVLVLGLGASGLAMARWCADNGARLTLWDSRAQPPQAATVAHELPGARLLHGAVDAQALLRGDALSPAVNWVLRSPGLMPHDPLVAPLVSAARERGVRVAGELELFARALQALQARLAYRPKVLAITGTNGKTTTTSLTTLLVERAGLQAVAAGNIGPTMLDTLRSHLLALPAPAWETEPGASSGGHVDGLPQVWVLELSSFQLHEVQAFEPSAAVVLNVTQDHLDWHGSMAAYAADKALIYGQQAVMVVNRDDPTVLAMVPAPVTTQTPRGQIAPTPRQVLHFGLSRPEQPGDFGVVEESGMAWLVRALPEDSTPVRRKRGAAVEAPEILLQRLMPVDALRLRGRHNASNALAALALATAIGCPLAPMLHGLREYRGEPHRVELVTSVGGVEAFDDSKGTNVGATVAALHGLGADRDPGKLVVILGGDGKGQDFSPLLPALARHARAVALIGRDGPAIGELLAADDRTADLPRQGFSTLPEAVNWCFDQARGHDAVLLSPACASLDMFKDYAHRAQVFVDAVRERALARGELLA